MKKIEIKNSNSFDFHDCPIHGINFEYEQYISNIILDIDTMKLININKPIFSIFPSKLIFKQVSNFFINLDRESDDEFSVIVSPVFMLSMKITKFSKNKLLIDIQCTDGELSFYVESCELHVSDNSIDSNEIYLKTKMRIKTKGV